jgi:hypothetical protein
MITFSVEEGGRQSKWAVPDLQACIQPTDTGFQPALTRYSGLGRPNDWHQLAPATSQQIVITVAGAVTCANVQHPCFSFAHVDHPEWHAALSACADVTMA